MRKIAFIVKTKGLEFDDRVRKEALSLVSLGYSVKIYVQLNSNKVDEGITSYGVPYESIELKTPKLFPASKFLIIKSLEFYFSLRSKLKEYDFIWCHEEYTFLFPLLLRKNTVIWDLHELPARFNSPIMARVFKLIEIKCLALIHANIYRLNYLKTQGLVQKPDKNFVINNYPDTAFLKSDIETPQFKEFYSWIKDSEYIYLQGLSTDKRLPYQSLKSIIETGLKAVVVGNVDELAIRRLRQEYDTDTFDSCLFFTGMIEQMATRRLMQQAKLSIVLYDDSTPNNQYCEANRLYQTVLSKVPVIVGKNPPMAELVTTYRCGIVLPNYGDDLKSIIQAISQIENDRPKYIIKNEYCQKLLWADEPVARVMDFASLKIK